MGMQKETFLVVVHRAYRFLKKTQVKLIITGEIGVLKEKETVLWM